MPADQESECAGTSPETASTGLYIGGSNCNSSDAVGTVPYDKAPAQMPFPLQAGRHVRYRFMRHQ